MPGTEKNEDRDQQILSRLAQIQHKVDALERSQAFAMRADSDRHLVSIMAVFGKSKRRTQVYLAANGSRSVGEIAIHLNMKPANVSRELKHLGDEGLLEIHDTQGHEVFWTKTPIERSFRISKFVAEHHGIRLDGKVL